MLTLALILVAICLGTFNLWKDLRTDYPIAHIFQMSFLLTLAGLTSLVWPYLGLLISLVVVIIWCKRRAWDAWECLDVVAPTSLLLAFVLAWSTGIEGWPVAVVAFAGWWLVKVLGKFYRQFGWYKSGRLGFVGLVALGWWGVIQLVVANLSWIAVYCFAAISVSAVVALYLRSGRKWREDFKIPWPKPKPRT